MRYVFPWLFLTLLFCKSEVTTVIKQPPTSEYSNNHIHFPYNLELPDTVFILDSVLGEISGLEYDEDKDCLLSHNDEKGNIYEIDKNSGKIQSKIKFAKSGDYEAIAYKDGVIYITKNTGDIFEYKRKSEKSMAYKTKLSSKNDVEGMCVDSKNRNLILACKGQPLNSSKHNNQKCLYSFNLSTHTIAPNPLLTIHDSDLEDWVKTNYIEVSKKDLSKKIKRVKEFAPSGVSYSYDKASLYLISARGSTLIIYDNNLQLESIHFLNPKTIPQPEGICFDKDKNLYISTEGKGFSGKIFKYKYRM